MVCRTEYDMKVIGRNLRRLREKKHLSVEQVREYLCLGSVQAVYKYEAGAGYPQADTLLALMELYDAGVNEILCKICYVYIIEKDRRWGTSIQKTTSYDWLKSTKILCSPSA